MPLSFLAEAKGLFIDAPNLRIKVVAEAIEEAGRCVIYSSRLNNPALFKK